MHMIAHAYYYCLGKNIDVHIGQLQHFGTIYYFMPWLDTFHNASKHHWSRSPNIIMFHSFTIHQANNVAQYLVGLRFYPYKHIITHTIHGTGIYLPTWMVDLYGKCIGKSSHVWIYMGYQWRQMWSLGLPAVDVLVVVVVVLVEVVVLVVVVVVNWGDRKGVTKAL